MWFTETAWPPIILCVIVAGVLAFAAFSSRRAAFAAGSVLLILACIPIYLIEQSIVTEAELIEAAVDDMVLAVQQGDAERCLSHISRQASDPSYAALAMQVQWAVTFLDIEKSPRVTDRSVELKAEGSRAIAHFRVNGRAAPKITGGDSQEFRTRWRLTWRKEADEWKVIKVNRLNVLTGEAEDVSVEALYR